MKSFPQSRRSFLKQASLAALAPGLCRLSEENHASAAEPVAAKVTLPEIIDTHTHFYDPTRPQGVPWPAKNTPLYRTVLPKHYKEFAKPLGVTGTVVVEASAWLEDNQWILDLAKEDPFIVGLVGHLEPGEEGFSQHVKRFAKDPIFRGIRIGQAALAKGLESQTYLDDLKRLQDHDLELDINGGPTLLPLVVKLADKLPELRILINHIANVKIDGKTIDPDWKKGIEEAAAHPRVWCKVSALVEGSRMADGQAPTDLTFYEPTLDVVWNAFGENRLIYGSNWPVSERFATYATVQNIVQQYFAKKGEAASRKYFSENAKTAYKWVRTK